MAKQSPEDLENTMQFKIGDSFFFDDDPVYPEYTETEADEIIFPMEIDEIVSDESVPSAEQDEILSHKKLSLAYISATVLDFAEDIGDMTIRLVKGIFKRLSPVFTVPFLLLYTLISNAVEKVKLSARKDFKKLSGKKIRLFEDIKSISKASSKKDNKYAFFFSNASRALWASATRHESFMKSMINIMLPVIAVALIFSAVKSTRDKIFALEVFYNGSSIGYVESQDTFNEGKEKALSLLSVSSEDSNKIAQPVYKIARVQLSELSNSTMITQKLIESSDVKFTRACGVFIDGEFLCAVRNETDAQGVFASILQPYEKKAERGTIVSFVEEIEYVQGFYPEQSDVIWDTLKLKKTLAAPKSKAVIHKVKKGDKLKDIAEKYSLTVSEIKALNPNTDFSKPAKIKTLLVSPKEDYVRVKVMKTQVRTLAIAYETVKRNTSRLAKGTQKTSQEGKNGVKEITELVTYINGKKSYTSTVSERQTKAPVNKIILVGTKTSSYSSSSSSSSSSRRFIWPTRGAYSVSSHYGYRSASISGWGFHGGIDIVLGRGSSAGIPVVASASGRVVLAYSGWSGYGHTVIIDHGNGIRTRYAHMYPGSLRVRTGDWVSQGQQIGKIGSTGNSTGPHLHFEVLVNGRKVNPYPYIR